MYFKKNDITAFQNSPIGKTIFFGWELQSSPFTIVANGIEFYNILSQGVGNMWKNVRYDPTYLNRTVGVSRVYTSKIDMLVQVNFGFCVRTSLGTKYIRFTGSPDLVVGRWNINSNGQQTSITTSTQFNNNVSANDFAFPLLANEALAIEMAGTTADLIFTDNPSASINTVNWIAVKLLELPSLSL
jgi:hypothetical protein